MNDLHLPFFFLDELNLNQRSYVMSEETSKHMIQVLRMQKREALHLTNGRGLLAQAQITDDHRKRCSVDIDSFIEKETPSYTVTLAISPLKNSSRFEWLLEKAAEIGVGSIIPLICTRTEKEQLRFDRLQGILISAMLQSQQTWKCELHEPIQLKKLIASAKPSRKLVAHCLPQQKNKLTRIETKGEVMILIGPEGDFTAEEIEACIQAGYEPVSLGDTRLRTETAGMVAATLLCIG